MLKRFFRDERGGTFVIFSFAILPLLVAIGSAVDYSRHALAQNALQQSLDAATLAVNKATFPDAQTARSEVARIVQGQIGERHRLAELTVTADVSADGRTLSTTAEARQSNLFMAVVGFRSSQIKVRSQTVMSSETALELVLVLDTTFSMTEKNKLSTLKTAASALVDSLASDPRAKVKIGIVPFARYVNVGTIQSGATWLTNTRTYTETTTRTIPAACTPAGCSMQRDVISETNCRTVPTTSVRDGVTIRGSREECDKVYGPARNVCTPEVCTPARTETNTTTYRWEGCVGSRDYPLNLTDASPQVPYPGIYNYTCADPVMPLSTDFSRLKSAINGLSANDETYMPSGLVWGLNVLSPGAPFTEGAAYDPTRTKTRKALVFMTDGVNTISMTSRTDGSHTGSDRTEADSYTSQLCRAIKGNGIELFSIALMVDDAQAKTLLQGCATDTAHYYDATNTQGLTDAFRKITGQLQGLYLSQ